MLPPDETSAGFIRHGAAVPRTPLVISVPHAGRDYPAALLRDTALPETVLAGLEDRHVDLLAAEAVDLGAAVLIAGRARAWIDLNRHERELDPAMIVPPLPADRLLSSAKVRGGLGLIPRRIAGAGEIWRRRLPLHEVEARIAADHRPWHGAIADALAAAHARFGVAVLLDLHSMPPLAPGGGGPARIVIGDRHRRSAAAPFVTAVQRVAGDAGIMVAYNHPYAGGYTLDRHGRPAFGVHALQVEIDRTLYLGMDMREPGDGLATTVALVTAMAAALLAAAGQTRPATLAAE